MANSSLTPLTPEEIAKKDGLSSIGVYQEDIFEAEFLMKFGFEAYWALHPEKDRVKGLPMSEMLRLTLASRKVDSINTFSMAQSVFMGSVAARGKNPAQTFERVTSKLLSRTKADK